MMRVSCSTTSSISIITAIFRLSPTPRATGLLKYMGYTTAWIVLAETARHKILRKCFQGPIPNVHERFVRFWPGADIVLRPAYWLFTLSVYLAGHRRKSPSRP